MGRDLLFSVTECKERLKREKRLKEINELEKRLNCYGLLKRDEDFEKWLEEEVYNWIIRQMGWRER